MDASALFNVATLLMRGADVVSSYLLTYALHSTVFLVAAWWIVARRRRVWSPAAQHGIWRVALLAGWLTSAAQLAAPWRPLGASLTLPAGARHAVASLQLLQPDAMPRGQTRQARALQARAQETLASHDREVHEREVHEREVRVLMFTVSRTTAAVAVWGAIALALLARLAIARRRLFAVMAARPIPTDAPVVRSLRALITASGAQPTIRLCVSDTLVAPAARSCREIVLPSRVMHDLADAERNGVLAHELAHAIRRDPPWLHLAMCVERVAWFQPLNRVARRQLQLTAEFAADQWAVQLTRQPLSLARALSRVAGWLPAAGAPSPRHAPGLDGSPLVERVRALTTDRHAGADVGAAEGAARAYAPTAVWLSVAIAALLLPGVESAPREGDLGPRTTNLTVLSTDAFEWTESTLSPRLPPPLADPPTGELTHSSVRFVRLRMTESRLLPVRTADSLVRAGATPRLVIVRTRATS